MAGKRQDQGLLGPLFEAAMQAEGQDSEELIEEQEPEKANENPIYTVSELAIELRDELKNRYPRIMVQGEIADFKGIHRSGHLYCGLKDESAQIRMVMWKGALAKLPFKIEGGQEVIVTAKVDFYPGGGSLQLSVENIEPVGVGALQLRFEQLKKKLRDEGLFEETRKKPIPAVNWNVGIVTGKSTAAFQDMLKIFRHRFPLAKVFLFHASVQGERAPKQIVQAIRAANRFSENETRLDCLIIGRGGGSYEDLFCFNEEIVARAIVESKLPTISGVGHEIDVTIADMVADRRAATPTHAAQSVVPDAATWMERLSELEGQMSRRMNEKIQDLRQTLDNYYNRLNAASPQKQLQSQHELLNNIKRRLVLATEGNLRAHRQNLARLSTKLDALSPLKVFDRGYSIVQNTNEGIVRSVKDLETDQIVELKFKDGKRQSRVL